MSRLHHASCVEFEHVGLLLRGAAGAGKSDLALRLIDAGATLIADDQVVISARDGRLVAQPPAALAGLLEIRGLGVVALPHGTETLLALAVDLMDDGEIARLPAAEATTIEGVVLPLIRLQPFGASAIARLRIAARLVDGRLEGVEAALGLRPARRSA